MYRYLGGPKSAIYMSIRQLRGFLVLAPQAVEMRKRCKIFNSTTVFYCISALEDFSVMWRPQWPFCERSRCHQMPWKWKLPLEKLRFTQDFIFFWIIWNGYLQYPLHETGYSPSSVNGNYMNPICKVPSRRKYFISSMTRS